jgi:hypothetical protein
VNDLVIRLASVCDHMPLSEFHDVFRIIRGWNSDLGYIIRVRGHLPCFGREARQKQLE